jgi:hypothetical protein
MRLNKCVCVYTYREPTHTDTDICNLSNYPKEHKLAAYGYFNYMHNLPVSNSDKQATQKPKLSGVSLYSNM